MIKPTVGRVIWIRNRSGAIPWSGSSPEPEVALIVCACDPTGYINVAGFDHMGEPFRLNTIRIKQGDPELDAWMEQYSGVYAEWMPYQKAVAAGEIPATQHSK